MCLDTLIRGLLKTDINELPGCSASAFKSQAGVTKDKAAAEKVWDFLCNIY